ncbi:MAG: hypothetical protein BWY76_00441 [bacterium ADurb.Bin429]|nr:MAG: hypothetical protein BWY76_00441 [bacterium ADurb.Bin429]
MRLTDQFFPGMSAADDVCGIDRYDGEVAVQDGHLRIRVFQNSLQFPRVVRERLQQVFALRFRLFAYGDIFHHGNSAIRLAVRAAQQICI